MITFALLAGQDEPDSLVIQVAGGQDVSDDTSVQYSPPLLRCL